MITGPQIGHTAAEQRQLAGLEIGGGNRPFRRDFEQFDAEDWNKETGLIYTLGDARKLPYPDEHFPQIYAGNILEHFPANETFTVLSEWARVLQIGGLLEIIVPDVIGILDLYYAERLSWVDAEVRLRGTEGLNRHRAGFTLLHFSSIVEQVPTLTMKLCEPCAEYAGIHALAIRVP